MTGHVRRGSVAGGVAAALVLLAPAALGTWARGDDAGPPGGGHNPGGYLRPDFWAMAREQAALARKTPSGSFRIVRRDDDSVLFAPRTYLYWEGLGRGPFPNGVLWQDPGGIRVARFPGGEWQQLVLDDESFPDDSRLPQAMEGPSLLTAYSDCARPPRVSPSGRYYLYLAAKGPAVLDLRSRRVSLIGLPPKGGCAWQWKGDDQIAVYTPWARGPETVREWSVRPRRGGPGGWRPLALPYPGVWSPQGDRLLTWRDWVPVKAEGYPLLVLSEQGKELAELGPVTSAEVAWSPNGRYVSGLLTTRDLGLDQTRYYTGGPLATRAFIWDLQTGDLMSPLSQAAMPPNTPLGQDWGELDPQRVRPPAQTGDWVVLSERALSWSTDSAAVAFAARVADGDDPRQWDFREERAPQEGYRLMVYEVASRRVRQIAPAMLVHWAGGGGPPVWLNHNREIAYKVFGESDLSVGLLEWRRVPLAGR